jgi:hypothetical protein
MCPAVFARDLATQLLDRYLFECDSFGDTLMQTQLPSVFQNFLPQLNGWFRQVSSGAIGKDAVLPHTI